MNTYDKLRDGLQRGWFSDSARNADTFDAYRRVNTDGSVSPCSVEIQEDEK